MTTQEQARIADLESKVQRLESKVADVAGRMARAARGSHPNEEIWMCDGCGEALMVFDREAHEYREKNKGKTIRVTPAPGSRIEVDCNNCGRKNSRVA